MSNQLLSRSNSPLTCSYNFPRKHDGVQKIQQLFYNIPRFFCWLRYDYIVRGIVPNTRVHQFVPNTYSCLAFTIDLPVAYLL